jgi:RimJ/RimL family protein N-acetyltransferase
MGRTDDVNYWDLGDIRLRTAVISDAVMFAGHFISSPAGVERSFEKILPPQTGEDAEKWLSGYGGRPETVSDARVFVIEGTETGIFLGYIDVWEADARNGVFKTGIKILEGHAGKGYATRAYARTLDYYFNELRYQKCDIYVYEFNEASLRFHKKFGFMEEGRLRREYYSAGRFYDSICLGLTMEDFNAYANAAAGTGARTYM